MDNRPIGVFDSGVGGISVLHALRQELPMEEFIYYGDTANAPYGTKTVSEVSVCAHRVVSTLLSMQSKAIVIACNTATSAAAAELRAELTVPVIGMEPALKPASMIRKNGRIIVLATPVTLNLEKFKNLMERYGEGAIPIPCPGLMETVEKEDWRQADVYLRGVLSPYQKETIDAVVLGCTHYSFLRGIVSSLLPGVPILDGNEGTARQLHRILREHDLLAERNTPISPILMSSDPSNESIGVMARLLELEYAQ